MKLQNLIHILIGIVCIGLLPGAQAVNPLPDGGYPGGNTAEGQNRVPSASLFAVGAATRDARADSQEAPPPCTSFMASWNNVAGATGYLLDVATSDSFSDHVDGYHDLDVGNVTKLVVTDLTPGTTYYYRVRAYTGIDPAIGPGNYSEPMMATTAPDTELPSDITAMSPEGHNLDAIGYDLVNAVVTTNAATNVTGSAATLNGTVNPNELATTVHFEYGTTTNYGSTTASSNHTGSTTQNVSANITGLRPNTTYHFRLVGTNSGGTTYGNDRTFIWLSPTGLPLAQTNAATNVASSSATLNGLVHPHGSPTIVYFEYEGGNVHGVWYFPHPKTGNTYQSVSVNITQLSPSTTYHFRIVTMNNAGTTYGSYRTFTTLIATGSPVVTTIPATNVAASSATLHGLLDPHGLITTVYLQYGTTTSYGHTTPLQSQTGNTFRNINADINGLNRHTTYHFRIVATNTAGTRSGSDRTFTTQ